MARFLSTSRLAARAIGGALALLASAGAGSSAAAGPNPFNLFHYRVSYQGSGSYAVTGQSSSGAAWHAQASFHWWVDYDLLFIHHRGHQLGAIAQPGPRGGGSWAVSFSNLGDQSCSGGGGLSLKRYGAISGSVGRDGTLVMSLLPAGGDYRSTGGSSGSGPCATTDFWGDWVKGFSKVGTGTQAIDPLTAVVLVKPRQLRRRQLTLRVSNQTLFTPQLLISPDCSAGQDGSCTQSFSWTGTVTLTKLVRR